jgi:hypothetical protein
MQLTYKTLPVKYTSATVHVILIGEVPPRSRRIKTPWKQQ